jgi:hypothetical protein
MSVFELQSPLAAEERLYERKLILRDVISLSGLFCNNCRAGEVNIHSASRSSNPYASIATNFRDVTASQHAELCHSYTGN